MVPPATQTAATIQHLPAGRTRKLATKAAKRESDRAAYAAKHAQQQADALAQKADARTQKEVAAEAARKHLLWRQARTQYQAARCAKLRANATVDMPAVLPFLTTRPCPVTGISLLEYNSTCGGL